jgi:hypothetical protein
MPASVNWVTIFATVRSANDAARVAERSFDGHRRMEVSSRW